MEESNGGLPDECSGVHAVDSGRIGLRDLVQLAVDSGVLGALRVEVVGVDLAPHFSRWYRERSNTAGHVSMMLTHHTGNAKDSEMFAGQTISEGITNIKG